MTGALRTFARLLATWYGALAVVFLLAAAILLPGLGTPGLWEPHERAAADKANPPPPAPAPAPLTAPPTPPQPVPTPSPINEEAQDTDEPPAAGANGVGPASGSAAMQSAPAGEAEPTLERVTRPRATTQTTAPASPMPPMTQKAGPTSPAPAPPTPTTPTPSTAPAERVVPPSAPNPVAPATPATTSAASPTKAGTDAECLRSAPKDAKARSLTTRAIAWGHEIVDGDAGRRLPFALMGLLTVLAAAGIAMRFAGGRAGVITAIVLLSMPLLTLQSRMLTSEIGTACGATLIVYAFVALSRLGAGYGTTLAAVDAAIGIASLVVGGYLGFYGGGALLGVLVPVGAVAAASALGSPLRGRSRGELIVTVGAVLATAYLVYLLVPDLYQWKDITPGMLPTGREVFGKVAIGKGCWSGLVGGIWRTDDDVRMIFDSTFEHVAYGTFPWGILAPVAMMGLVLSADRDKRGVGALALAWAAAAWIGTEVFQRKIGFAVFAGFPAIAIAIGVWLDDVFSRRSRGDATAMPAGMILAGMFLLIAVVTLGKDMFSFPDRITSLLIGDLGNIGNEPLKYPKESRLLLVPTKAWILGLGALAGLGFALSSALWRDGESAYARWSRRVAPWCAAGALVASVAMAGFWSFGWQAKLAQHLSSKAMFDTFAELAKPGDRLVIMGDLGTAAASYTTSKPEVVNSRDAVVKAMSESSRVFAIAPASELCQLHRDLAAKPYFVVDDRNVRNHLLSNKLDGAVDHNPLATAILHEAPAKMSAKPKAPVIWDKRLELIGWDVPTRMKRGKKYPIKLYYKVLQTVGGKWKSLMHIDGALRFNGNGCCDHWPIDDLCPTSSWQPGDFIVDTYTVTAGGKSFPSGKYEMWIGFFTGQTPNFKNMPISDAPTDMRDTAERVKITSIQLD